MLGPLRFDAKGTFELGVVELNGPENGGVVRQVPTVIPQGISNYASFVVQKRKRGPRDAGETSINSTATGIDGGIVRRRVNVNFNEFGKQRIPTRGIRPVRGHQGRVRVSLVRGFAKRRHTIGITFLVHIP